MTLRVSPQLQRSTAIDRALVAELLELPVPDTVRSTMVEGGRAKLAGSCIAIVGSLLLTSHALGQTADESTLAAARQLGQQGVAHYQDEQYAAALDKLERAYAVVKVPTLGLWSARALAKLGKLVEASHRYREVTLMRDSATDPEVFRSARADAQTEYETLNARLPQITIEISGATPNEASVSVDGKSLPSQLVGAAVPVNPGKHTVAGRRGQEVVTESVTLLERDRRAVRLRFQRPPLAALSATTPASIAKNGSAKLMPPRNSPSTSIAPWLIVAAGGASAAIGGILVALALAAKSNVEGSIDGTKWSAARSDHDHVPTYSRTGFVLLGVGAAATTAGLVWKYTSSEGAPGGLSVEVRATGVVLTGAL